MWKHRDILLRPRYGTLGFIAMPKVWIFQLLFAAVSPLAWLILLQRFAYRQIMYWVVVRSFAATLRGRVVGWGKLERRATVEVPS